MNKQLNDHSNWALLSALLLIFTSPVQAAYVYAHSAVVYNEGLGDGRIVVNGPFGTGPSATGFNSNLVPGLAASGYGRASYGALHASAFSAATIAGPSTTETRGQGSSGWIDQLTISSPTLTGLAFAHASFSLAGGLTSLSGATAVGAVGNSTVSASVSIDGQRVFSTGGQLVSRNGVITTNDMSRGLALNGGAFQQDPVTSLTGVFSFDIPFVFGTPFRMDAELNAFVQALASAAGDQASAYSSFGSSGYWGGISGVHLADGTVLSGYNLSSQSGFNWNNAASPVPVPAAVWLLGSGLLGLIGVARRKAIGV